jgi:hypothetical protein
MKKILFLTLLISTVFFCKAQTISSNLPVKDSLVLKGDFWKGVKYSYQGVDNVDIRKVRKTLNIDNENAMLMHQAKTTKVISMVSAVAGGMSMGVSVSTWLAGGKFSVPLFASGAGLMALSLPISALSVKKMRKAVARFNAAH